MTVPSLLPSSPIRAAPVVHAARYRAWPVYEPNAKPISRGSTTPPSAATRYRHGFPKPAVIHAKNGIGWSAVPDPNTPPLHREALYFVYERSEFLAEILNWFNIVGDQWTTVHPNAADENEIVDWTLRKFSKLEIKNKMLLLQYPRDLGATEVTEKRKLILGIANELSLKVIDTYDVLSNAKENKLWYPGRGHHTPLGNELVCSYLFEQGFSKQTSTSRPDSPSYR